ncbi:MAG: NYN domain-containing protein [Dehalococcoidales bacterium]|nr:NYN domain-containing protein [Dehalococcoidales bacterium]
MPITTLYVDVENLTEFAKKAIVATLEQWPADFPKPDNMRFYVRADQTRLWHFWADHMFPEIKVSINGIQRYGYGVISKNLADMALVLDAISDLLTHRVTHIAILSDDSDYVALFSAIKQELPQYSSNDLPFMWFLTDRPDTHSRALNDFLPARYLRTISYTENKVAAPAPAVIVEKPPIMHHIPVMIPREKPPILNRQPEYEAIAKAIIQRIPVGPFRSNDCMKIVRNQFPNNHISKSDNATFGNQFAKNIWPLLEKAGVRLPNPDKKPRKYEMTEEAKKTVTAL